VDLVPEPVFPKEFLHDGCYKVAEAKEWREEFGLPPDPEDDLNFAECQFRHAGFGMECTSCDKFLQGVHMTPEEEKFLPLIRKYYEDAKKYEEYQQYLGCASNDCGSGI
jgi:hypothetical protein